MRRPLFYPLIALMAGIMTGDHISMSYDLIFTASVFILLLLLFTIRKNKPLVSLSLICFFVFLIGFFNIQKQEYVISNPHHILYHSSQGKITLEGIVEDSYAAFPDKNILIVQCVRQIKDSSYSPISGNIRLVIPGDLQFQYGDFIRFHSNIKKIQSFQNPGGFDYERHMKRQGIYAVGFISSPTGIILLRQNTADNFQSKVESFRLYLKKIIFSNASTPEREIIEAMTIGNQNEIPFDVRDHFNKTGTSHILSISGLHLGMVAAMAFFLISILLKSFEYLMLRFNTMKVAAAASFILVLIYAYIAGMGITVMRSTFMALAFLFSLLIGKQKDLYNTLSLAALIILIILPAALFDISFQLSFSSVLSLIYIVPKFSHLSFDWFPDMPIKLKNIIHQVYLIILVSFAATIGTLPLIIFHFNRVSVVTILANLIVVPILGIAALIFCMAFILAALFSPLIAGLFVKTAAFFVQISVIIIKWLADLSWSSFNFTKPNMAEITLFYLLLILLVEATQTHKTDENIEGFWMRHPVALRNLLIASLCLIAADGVYLSVKEKLNNNLKITAIDVGQGSSTLVQFPHGINMLIDGGGFADSSFDMGKMVIAPFLYAERISKIDIVVLTHPHPDHLQGLIYIVNNFAVRELWCTGLKADDDLFRELEKAINKSDIKIKYVSAQTQPVKINGVEIKILWPLKPLLEEGNQLSYEDANDSSLVMKIIYDNSAFLFTADISASVEDLLIKSGQNLQSDILFVPHHGSVYSSTPSFIGHVKNSQAIFSAGKTNVFRHPHPVILERYQSAGINIYRTDKNGAITLVSDGKIIHVNPYLPNR
jgi:competence protein ComEC